jgi:hypothetical protein
MVLQKFRNENLMLTDLPCREDELSMRLMEFYKKNFDVSFE